MSHLALSWHPNFAARRLKPPGQTRRSNLTPELEMKSTVLKSLVTVAVATAAWAAPSAQASLVTLNSTLR